jgi:hypothetical protein
MPNERLNDMSCSSPFPELSGMLSASSSANQYLHSVITSSSLRFLQTAMDWFNELQFIEPIRIITKTQPIATITMFVGANKNSVWVILSFVICYYG